MITRYSINSNLLIIHNWSHKIINTVNIAVSTVCNIVNMPYQLIASHEVVLNSHATIDTAKILSGISK